MIDQPKASKLAKEAFDHWQAGRPAQSEPLYEEALRLADPNHFGLSAYHGEYACVLNELGKHNRATEQLERSLAVELAHKEVEGSPAVTMARYFLAEQLLRQGSPVLALEALAPSVSHAPNDWPTRLAEARVLFALERKTEAKTAARLAIANAPTPKKAQELEQELSEVFRALDT